MIELVKTARMAEEQSSDVSAVAVVRALCRQQSPTSYFCSFFLPIAERGAVYAVYAFGRGVYDAARQGNPHEAAASIARQRRTLDRLYSGEFQPSDEADPATLALADAIHQYNIPRQHFLDLLQGAEMDLSIREYQTWDDLKTYCYHTGGVVGLIVSRILGVKSAGPREHAVQLGTAVRLTHILRDVNDDLHRGRIYLPQDDLDRFGVSRQDLIAGHCNGSFHHLMQFEINRARMMYREASQGLCHLQRDGSRLAASAMAVLSAGILNRIERHDYDVFHHRADLSALQRFIRLPLAWRLCRRNHHHPLPDVFAAG